MKKDLQLKGTTEISGLGKIPIIYGGFSDNQKVMLVKTIAEIHGVRVGDINDLINSNLDEFEFGVDILDLKSAIDTKDNEILKNLGFTQNSLNASKKIYILSEQGYMTLVMLMRTNKAKQIRKKIRKQYFAMREILNKDEQLKKDLLFKLYQGGVESIEASRQLVDLETKPLLKKIECKKEIESTNDLIDFGQMAKVLSTAGFKIGRNNLTKLLRKEGSLIKNQCILMTDTYDWKGRTYTNKNHNVPYQTYIDRGYFKTREYALNNKIKFKVLITLKGQQWLIKLFEQKINEIE